MKAGFHHGDTTHGLGLISPLGKAPMKTLLGDPNDINEEARGHREGSPVRSAIPISPHSGANTNNEAKSRGLIQDWSRTRTPFSPLPSDTSLGPSLGERDDKSVSSTGSRSYGVLSLNDEVSTLEDGIITSAGSKERDTYRDPLLSALLPLSPEAMARTPLPPVRTAGGTASCCIL